METSKLRYGHNITPDAAQHILSARSSEQIADQAVAQILNVLDPNAPVVVPVTVEEPGQPATFGEVVAVFTDNEYDDTEVADPPFPPLSARAHHQVSFDSLIASGLVNGDRPVSHRSSWPGAVDLMAAKQTGAVLWAVFLTAGVFIAGVTIWGWGL